MSQLNDLHEAAIGVLNKNWRTSSTIPSSLLYPHQWSWDSAFTAIGLSHFNQERAQLELLSLFDGQWVDGRIPHIKFNGEVDENAYFPGPKFWDSQIASGLSEVKSSGIIQPAVHARAALDLFRNSADKKVARDFLREIYPKLVKSHEYIFKNRVRSGSALAYIVHPWESGLDNSPFWDEPLARIPVDATLWTRFERRDVEKISSEQRPSDDDYSRYIQLALEYKDANYLDDAHFATSKFSVIDPLFNALLAWSEEALAGIAIAIGLDSKPHEEKSSALVAALVEELYDSSLGIFVAKDVLSGTRIRKISAAGLVPIVLSHLPESFVIKICETLTSDHFALLNSKWRGVPSFDLSDSGFNPHLYWRGPVWINISWLVWRGLRVHGRDELANPLAAQILDLVRQRGFYEYFHPKNGDGLGSPEFTWTAALVVDLLESD